MPRRLVINPVVVVNGVRRPKCATILDPGAQARESINDDGNPVIVRPTYDHRSVFSSGQAGQRNETCLSLVSGIDLSALDADPEIVTVFEASDLASIDELAARLARTPREDAWPASLVNRLKTRIEAAGADATTLDRDSPLYVYANRLAQAIQPGTDVREWAPSPSASLRSATGDLSPEAPQGA